MKKLISLMLALIMVLSLATVASADEVTYTAVAAGTEFTINKTYENEGDVTVHETLTFTPVADPANPEGGATGNITVDNYVVGTSDSIKVTLPGFSKVGTYRFTITENDANSAGVTYSTDTIHVIALVVYDNTNDCLKIENVNAYIEKIDGEKDQDFTNTFKTGKFSVAKNVTGNMANRNDDFEIVVTLSAPAGDTVRNYIKIGGVAIDKKDWTTYTETLTISAADGPTTFDDIPVGVTVTVAETQTDDKMNGYTYVSTKVGEENFTSLTVADDTASDIVVTNEKKTEISTGIVTDSAPYIILIAVCAVAAVAFVLKRRNAVEF